MAPYKNTAEYGLDLWFAENWSKNTRFSIRVTNHLYSKKSSVQKIDILESEEFGRVLTFDGRIALTEKDGFIYHDLIVHPAMCVNPMIKKVLVLGNGSGGVVRELTRYRTITQIDLVERDEQVVRACERFLPHIATKPKDARIHLYFEDEIVWAENAADGEYDLIIAASGSGATSMDFYENCFRILSEQGIFVTQYENPHLERDAYEMRQVHANIANIFPISKAYQAHIPSHTLGYRLFGFASKTLDPIQDADLASWNCLGLETGYYNTNLNVGAFMLPTYVKEMLNDCAFEP